MSGAARFQAELDAFAAKVRRRYGQLHAELTLDIRDSVIFGSPVTGAPGQPVDTGNLRTSWVTAFLEPLLSRVSTGVGYAGPVEHGIGRGGKPMTLRSKVGGFHSVKLTRANFEKMVPGALERVVRRDV